MITLTASRPLHWKGRKVAPGETLVAPRASVERQLRTGLLVESTQSRKGGGEVNEITAEEVPSLPVPLETHKKHRKTKQNDS